MSLANKRSYEDSLNGSLEIEFGMPMRKVTVINDSISASLKFKLNKDENYSTLKAGETLQMEDIRMPSLFLQATGATYRVWALG
jgi:hypothetical protein